MVFCTLSALAHVALYIPYRHFFGSSPTSITTFGAITWTVFALPALWMYPGQGWKTLFLWSVSGVVNSICIGPGNLASALLPTGGAIPPQLAYVFVTTAVSIPVMAGLLTIRRRFTRLYDATGERGTWLRMTALVGILFALQLIVGNIYSLQNTTPQGFLIARLMNAFALFAILYIAGLAQRQAAEASDVQARAAAAEEEVRQKDEAHARIVWEMEETNRLRHDQRQMFTVMRGLNAPGKESELEAYCHEALAQMRRAEQDVKRHEPA
jgi:hypothetical protein